MDKLQITPSLEIFAVHTSFYVTGFAKTGPNGIRTEIQFTA